jgi:dolichyl-phosphate beta-glucosyltransferase
MFISIIIPCYNESANLRRGVLRDVYKFLSGKMFSWEVLVSDDGSSDNSKEIIKSEIAKLRGFRLIENAHGGKPMALLGGIREAKGDYILFTDMDQSTPVTELEKLLPYVKDHDVVIGSRGMHRENFPLYRKLGSAIFMGIRRFLILPEIKDTQCGFKLFEATALKRAFPKLEFFQSKKQVVGWKVTSFDVELLQILKRMRKNIKEVTVLWTDEDTSQSKGGGLSRYIKESQEMFLQIFRVKINELRGVYK